MDAVDERHEDDEAWPPLAVPDTPQPEDHGALVLLDNPHRQRNACGTKSSSATIT
jgi:hypothetical protein